MKEIIILTIVSGLAFLLFLVTLILGLTKKNKKLKLTALFLFFTFIGLTAWTGKSKDFFNFEHRGFFSKKYHKKRKVFVIQLVSYFLCCFLSKPLRYHQFLRTRSVGIKPFSTFGTEFSGSDHVNQERTRGVFGVTKTIVQYA